MLKHVRSCIKGCKAAALVPPLAAPLIYVTDSVFLAPPGPSTTHSFSAFDLLFSIPVGGFLGLCAIAFLGFPIMILLVQFQLNRVWLVATVGCIIGVALAASVPVSTQSVTFLYGVVGAIAGGVASQFSSPKT